METPDVPQNTHHRLIQEMPPVRELAWNADHTYSMSFKILQKLGIVMEVPSGPQMVDTTLASGRVSPRSRDSGDCSNKDNNEQKAVTVKAEPMDPSYDSSVQDDKVIPHPLDQRECESCDFLVKVESLESGDTSALAETKFDTEETSKEKDADVVSGSPMSNIADAQPSHELNEDSVSEFYTKEEVEGSDDEGKVVTTTPERNPGIPVTEFKNECRITGLDQDEGSRGDTDAELQMEGKTEGDLETVGDEGCSTDSPEDPFNGGGKVVGCQIEKLHRKLSKPKSKYILLSMHCSDPILQASDLPKGSKCWVYWGVMT